MKQFRRDTVRQLQADLRLKGKCCHCDEAFPLADALLFYADQPPPPQANQIILRKKAELAERRRELKERRISARQTAERITVDVNIGKILEKLAPALDGFGYNPRDCRPLFDPIDYIVFQGLSQGSQVDSLVFVDIKTGGAGLSQRQRSIRDAVTSGRVESTIYRFDRPS